MGLFDRFKSNTAPTQQGLTAKEWCDKADALLKSGRHQEALTSLYTAREVNPHDAQIPNVIQYAKRMIGASK